jgi:hypothetical protein
MRKRDRVRAEARRGAGDRRPSLRERAVALARERGVVQTRELTKIGLHRCYLARMCSEGLLEKVGYGAYRAVDRQSEESPQLVNWEESQRPAIPNGSSGL